MTDVNQESQAIVPSMALPIASPYGTAPVYSRVHYSLSSIMQNPLRHYPSAMSLYGGALPDGTLLNAPLLRGAGQKSPLE